ncbi:MAG TPA: M23 family metallopeptidase [Rhizomicrobium sp.]|nr:M23 family metallopeptidase [Rhizomicrobium sp.]
MPGINANKWKRSTAAAVLLLPLVFTGCASVDDSRTQLDWGMRDRDSNHVGATYYTVRVRPGDTLSQIAQRYDVSVSDVVRLNDIENRDTIRVGDVIRVPAGSRATRDAVYADAMSRPSASNPYVPAPEPRRGGYPQSSTISVVNLPPPPARADDTTGVRVDQPAKLAPVAVATNTITPSVKPSTSPVQTTTPAKPKPEPYVVASNTDTPAKKHAWYTPSTPAQQPQVQPKPQVQPAAQPKPQPTQVASNDTPSVQVQQSVPGSSRFAWPVSGRIIASYGSTTGGERNDGINIGAQAGEPFRAAASGTVTYAGNQLRGYGNLLLIKHDDGYITAYAHAQSLLVQQGNRVLKGQVIGTVGQTGDVREPQLHFEIRNGVKPVNPLQLLVASR